jgi:DNA-binding transcriptional regulator YiaG
MAILKDKGKRQKLRQDLYERLDREGVSLSLAIKELRKILGLNQAEFAKLVGQSLSTLRKVEQANGNVTMKSVQKILTKFSFELVVVRRKR